MKLFSAETYKNRRAILKSKLKTGQILLMGNAEEPYNFTANTYRFRQDSTFLYYFGINLPNLCAFIDIDNDIEIIFGEEYTLEDIIWIGKQDSLQNLCEKVGINSLHPKNKLSNFIKTEKLHYLPPYRASNQLFLSNLINIDSNRLAPSDILIESVIEMREKKSEEEIIQLEEAVNITGAMHIAAMKFTKPQRKEYEIVAKIMETMHSQNAELAYPVILSKDGQTLHNHYHGNTLESGQLLLNDSGAENQMGYAGDITRSFPVNGKFTEIQKEIYEIVLNMQLSAIEATKPGVLNRDIHWMTYRILIDGLKNVGILKGDTESMLELGVAGMFMPHGLGHAIGLDVHDMEDLGEDKVGYRQGLVRDTRMGLKSLRFAKELEVNHVITIEPGCYFIPELINKNYQDGNFMDFVNYDKLNEFNSFGGIRIEDNIQVTADGPKVLGNPIPKTVKEIEEIMMKS